MVGHECRIRANATLELIGHEGNVVVVRGVRGSGPDEQRGASLSEKNENGALGAPHVLLFDVFQHTPVCDISQGHAAGRTNASLIRPRTLVKRLAAGLNRGSGCRLPAALTGPEKSGPVVALAAS